MKCSNDQCGSTAIYGGLCVPCFYIHQQVDAMRNVANDPAYQAQFFPEALAPRAVDSPSQIEWPDEVDKDWVL